MFQLLWEVVATLEHLIQLVVVLHPIWPPSRHAFKTLKDFPNLENFQLCSFLQVLTDTFAVNAAGGSDPNASNLVSSSATPTTLPFSTNPASRQALNFTLGGELPSSEATQFSDLSAGRPNLSGSSQQLGDDYATNLLCSIMRSQFIMLGLLRLTQLDPS
ncbi:hypothetical protein [Echinococcus multilocularis]|uniref:Uncharacterized protein n=1 Tax=Echinococcus multilocularis TaxID=6211 RepID=A0A0S4MQP4_ECHMU|nr:hypothetical protein [Echinococcus multilocularis]